MQQATPKKLPSGGWGARVSGSVSLGETIQITTRSGKSWQAQVTAIVEESDDCTVVATVSLDRRKGQSRNRGRGSCQEGEQRGDFQSIRAGTNVALMGQVFWLRHGDERFPATCVGWKSEYVSEDGLSFGYPEDEGWFTTVYSRKATEAEAAPLIQEEQEQKDRIEREKREKEERQAAFERVRDEALQGLRQSCVIPEGVTSGPCIADSRDWYHVNLYRASDGGVIMEANGHDDWRSYYYGTPEVVKAAVLQWAKEKEITREKAKEWLEKYGKC